MPIINGGEWQLELDEIECVVSSFLFEGEEGVESEAEEENCLESTERN